MTGELFNLGCTETLDVPLGYDTSLEKNYGVYAEAAKEIAKCRPHFFTGRGKV